MSKKKSFYSYILAADRSHSPGRTMLGLSMVFVGAAIAFVVIGGWPAILPIFSLPTKLPALVWWHWIVVATALPAVSVVAFRLKSYDYKPMRTIKAGGDNKVMGSGTQTGDGVAHNVCRFIERLPHKAMVRAAEWEGPFTYSVRLDIEPRQPSFRMIGARRVYEGYADTAKESDALIDSLQTTRTQKRMSASLGRPCNVRYDHNGFVIEVSKIDGEQRTPRADRGLMEYCRGSKMAVGVDNNNRPVVIDFSTYGMTGVMGPPGGGKTQMLLSMAYMFLRSNPRSKVHVFCAPGKYTKDWGKLDGIDGLTPHTDYSQMSTDVIRIDAAMTAGQYLDPILVIFDDMTALVPHLDCEDAINSLATMGRDLNTYMVTGTHGASSEYLGGNKVKAAMGLKIMYRVANTTQGASVSGEKNTKHNLMGLSGLPGDAVIDYRGEIFRAATPWLPDEAIVAMPRRSPARDLNGDRRGLNPRAVPNQSPPIPSVPHQSLGFSPVTGRAHMPDFVVAREVPGTGDLGIDYSGWSVDDFESAMTAAGYPRAVNELGRDDDDLLWATRMESAGISGNMMQYCLMGNREKPRANGSGGPRREALLALMGAAEESRFIDLKGDQNVA